MPGRLHGGDVTGPLWFCASEASAPSAVAAKKPFLTSDRGKIVEKSWKTMKNRDDKSGLSPQKTVNVHGKNGCFGGSFPGNAVFASNKSLDRAGQTVFLSSEAFHDFSTIRVTKHKKSPCFTVYEKW